MASSCVVRHQEHSSERFFEHSWLLNPEGYQGRSPWLVSSGVVAPKLAISRPLPSTVGAHTQCRSLPRSIPATFRRITGNPLPVHIDDDRSRRRVLKILFLPNQRAVPGIQRDYGVAVLAKLDNDRVLVGDRAYRVATVHKSATGEILVEILLPHHLAGFLVEGVHLGQDSDGVNTIAENERCTVWSGSVFHPHSWPEDGVVGVLSLRLSSDGVDGNYNLLVATSIHRVEQRAVSHDAGVAFTQIALPEPLGSSSGEGCGKPVPIDGKITAGSSPGGPSGR